MVEPTAHGRAARRAHQLRRRAAAASTSRSRCRPAPPRAARCASPAALRATVEAVTLARADRARRDRSKRRRRWSSGGRSAEIAPRHRSPTASRRSGLPPATRCEPARPLRTADLMKPELVAAQRDGDAGLRVPGIMLTVRGKAIEAAPKATSSPCSTSNPSARCRARSPAPAASSSTPRSPRLAANIAPADAIALQSPRRKRCP